MKLLHNLRVWMSKYSPGWTFYTDRQGQWRWRHVSKNRRIVGASTQGYSNWISAYDNAVMNGLIPMGPERQHNLCD